MSAPTEEQLSALEALLAEYSETVAKRDMTFSFRDRVFDAARTALPALITALREERDKLKTVLDRETASQARHDARAEALEAEAQHWKRKHVEALASVCPAPPRTALLTRAEAAEAEVKRLREALRDAEAALESGSMCHNCGILGDAATRARQALGGSNE